jgi:Uma2 family endonuclease
MAVDLQGIPMTEMAFIHLTNAEEGILYRYEYIDGALYDMTGSSPEHEALVFSILGILYNHTGKKGSWRVFHNQYVAIPNKPPVVPDAVVSCNSADWEKDKRLKPFKVQYPCIVFEVLSPSTESYNRTEKFARYRRCASLEDYVLVNQNRPLIEVYRRATGWQPELFSAGQVIKFEQIDLELPVDSVYEGVL